MTSAQAKTDLRQKIKEQLRDLPLSKEPQKRAAAGQALALNAQELPHWQRSLCILGFLPFADEVEVLPLLALALQQGKRVYLPRIKGHDMNFFEVGNLEGPWQKHRWGMQEPLDQGPPWSPSEATPAVILVPGLAYSCEGKRLGRGGGFFDRWLQKNLPTKSREVFLLGVAWEAQILGQIPTEAHDFDVEGLVTERSLRIFDSRSDVPD